MEPCAKPLLILTGLFSAITSGAYMRSTLSKANSVEQNLGSDWRRAISERQSKNLLDKPWTLWPGLSKEKTNLRFEQDIALWTIADSERRLLCDIWRPPKNTPHSGIGVIYMHGSAWNYINKDSYADDCREGGRHSRCEG